MLEQGQGQVGSWVANGEYWVWGRQQLAGRKCGKDLLINQQAKRHVSSGFNGDGTSTRLIRLGRVWHACHTLLGAWRGRVLS